MKFVIEKTGDAELATALDGLEKKKLALGETTGRFTGLIRAERQEQRMVNFAVREGISAISAFTGENRILNQVIGGTVNSYSGVSFAVQAMGEKFAAFAMPAGAAVGAFFLMNTLMTEQKKLWADLEKAATANTDALKKYGLITDEQWRKVLVRRLDVAKEAEKNAGSGFSWDNLFAQLAGGSTGLYANIMTDVLNKQTAVVEATGKIKEHDKEVLEKNKKISEELQKQLELRIRTGNIGVNRLGMNIPGVRPNVLRDDLLFTQDTPMGDIQRKQNRLDDVEAELKATASGERRVELLKERKKLQQDINDLNMTDIERQQEALSILGGSLSSIQNAMDRFGISQTSLIGQMIEGFQRVLAIVEAINAIQSAVSSFSSLLSIIGLVAAPATGGASAVPFIGSTITAPNVVDSGKSKGGLQINYNVQANDSKSFGQMLDTPAHRRELNKAITRLYRSNN